MQQRHHFLTGTRRRAARFLVEDEDGGPSTIEFVLWLPVFILILCIIVDVCFLFLAQARMYDVTADIARQYAIGQMGQTGLEACSATDSASEAAAEAAGATRGAFNGVTPTVSVAECSELVTVVMEHQLRDIDVIGVLNFVASNTLTATVEQIVE